MGLPPGLFISRANDRESHCHLSFSVEGSPEEWVMHFGHLVHLVTCFRDGDRRRLIFFASACAFQRDEILCVPVSFYMTVAVCSQSLDYAGKEG